VEPKKVNSCCPVLGIAEIELDWEAQTVEFDDFFTPSDLKSCLRSRLPVQEFRHQRWLENSDDSLPD
jgi:hypothetical protein